MDITRLKRSCRESGAVTVELCGYGGEDDFYMIYGLLEEIICPDEHRENVDSLCVMATFKKDGILIKASSEGLTANAAIEYKGLSPEQKRRAEGWIAELAARLPERG